MTRGIYITANDRVTEQAIALLNSIRLYDASTPVTLIPYDDQYYAVYETLQQRFGVQLYPDLAFVDRLSQQLRNRFGDQFFARPNQFRKQACWFGPYDQFLYIDTDIVVFECISEQLNYLDSYDFICCDYQHKGGLTNVFTSAVLEENVFTATEVNDLFNCGFWGANRGAITEADLYATFDDCAAHPHYFDFSQKTSDQPIINYMILTRIPRRFNIVRRPGGCPGNWAGTKGFVREGDRLIDPNVNQPLMYLHWAGFRLDPSAPYWDVWEHYRYFNEEKPTPIPSPPTPLSRQLKGRLKGWLKSLR